MPCTMTGSLEGDRAWAAEQSVDRLQKKITELTAMLCATCLYLEANDVEPPKKVKKWWKEHKKIDNKKGV